MIKIHGNDMILPSLFSAPGRVGPVQQALQHLRQELPERPRRQHRDIPERESVGRSDRGIDYLISNQVKMFILILTLQTFNRRLRCHTECDTLTGEEREECDEMYCKVNKSCLLSKADKKHLWSNIHC